MIERAISTQPLRSQLSYRYDDDLASGMDATERLAYQRRQLRERLGLADRPEAASKALQEEEELLNSAFRPRPRPRPTQMQAAAAHARACRPYREYCMCLTLPRGSVSLCGRTHAAALAGLSCRVVDAPHLREDSLRATTKCRKSRPQP
jgi:hypothetical protein